MIRKATLNINYANPGKLQQLGFLMDEMASVVNKFIEVLWDQENFSSKYIDFKVDTWLSARLQQCLGKQALEIVKSQRKKKKKTKPVFRGTSFNLDSRFVDFREDQNSFDMWTRLSSLGDRLKIKLPSKKHKQFNKFTNQGWTKKGSIQLRRNKNRSFSVNVFFEKKTPETKSSGKTVGVDCGYKKLLVSSDSQIYDLGLEDVYEKISRKQQGSKGFKRALVERNNLINQSLNQIDLAGTKEIVCENLKEVKKGSKGKIRKKFNNKLQRWSYPKVLGKLSRLADEQGVLLTKVNPAYTSQTCNLCGVVDKKSRNGSVFQCTACGSRLDADLNAAINLSHMGVYSPRVV